MSQEHEEYKIKINKQILKFEAFQKEKKIDSKHCIVHVPDCVHDVT